MASTTREPQLEPEDEGGSVGAGRIRQRWLGPWVFIAMIVLPSMVLARTITIWVPAKRAPKVTVLHYQDGHWNRVAQENLLQLKGFGAQLLFGPEGRPTVSLALGRDIDRYEWAGSTQRRGWVRRRPGARLPPGARYVSFALDQTNQFLLYLTRDRRPEVLRLGSGSTTLRPSLTPAGRCEGLRLAMNRRGTALVAWLEGSRTLVIGRLGENSIVHLGRFVVSGAMPYFEALAIGEDDSVFLAYFDPRSRVTHVVRHRRGRWDAVGRRQSLGQYKPRLRLYLDRQGRIFLTESQERGVSPAVLAPRLGNKATSGAHRSTSLGSVVVAYELRPSGLVDRHSLKVPGDFRSFGHLIDRAGLLLVAVRQPPSQSAPPGGAVIVRRVDGSSVTAVGDPIALLDRSNVPPQVVEDPKGTLFLLLNGSVVGPRPAPVRRPVGRTDGQEIETPGHGR